MPSAKIEPVMVTLSVTTPWWTGPYLGLVRAYVLVLIALGIQIDVDALAASVAARIGRHIRCNAD